MNFLRFPDESAWTAAATAAGFFSEPDEDGNTTLAAYTMTMPSTLLARSPVEVSTTQRLAM
jgi:hypothetical protein